MNSPFPMPSRIPQGRLEKARYYVELARADTEVGRLHSAESFLRLASVLDPANPEIRVMLQQVAASRARQRHG